MPRSLIGARIREQRRSLGITQAGLAARIGISSGCIAGSGGEVTASSEAAGAVSAAAAGMPEPDAAGPAETCSTEFGAAGAAAPLSAFIV